MLQCSAIYRLSNPTLRKEISPRQVCPRAPVLWFLARLTIDSEDEFDMFPQNVDSHTDYTALFPEDGSIHNYRRENLRCMVFICGSSELPCPSGTVVFRTVIGAT
jgi:hypothetical protein